MINREIAISIIISSIAFGLIFQIQGLAMGQIRPPHQGISPEDIQKAMTYTKSIPCWKGDGDVAASGTNIYTVWECYNHILFAKSNDGGKTYANTMLMSAPETNPKIMNDNVSISASGNTVAVMWDSNSTGISNPVLRTSSDGGNTFSNIVTLNSTPGGINKPIGANMTSTSNTTGAAGNTSAHSSSIPTTKPAGCSFLDPRC
jgi:hypothetical protein